MNIVTTKISHAEVFFEKAIGNYTIGMLKTEKDEHPLSFRMPKSEISVEEWQFMRILDFVGVKRSYDLIGKEIKVVLDEDLKVVGYGSTVEDSFFLLQNEEIRSYTEADLLKLAAQGSDLLKRSIH